LANAQVSLPRAQRGLRTPSLGCAPPGPPSGGANSLPANSSIPITRSNPLTALGECPGLAAASPTWVAHPIPGVRPFGAAFRPREFPPGEFVDSHHPSPIPLLPGTNGCRSPTNFWQALAGFVHWDGPPPPLLNHDPGHDIGHGGENPPRQDTSGLHLAARSANNFLFLQRTQLHSGCKDADTCEFRAEGELRSAAPASASPRGITKNSSGSGNRIGGPGVV